MSRADIRANLLLLNTHLLREQRFSADFCLSVVMADALPGWKLGPRLVECLGEASLGANAPTGSPQVGARSHHMGPGGILFQHLLDGQGRMLGLFALHGAGVLVDAGRVGGEKLAILPVHTQNHRPRQLPPVLVLSLS